MITRLASILLSIVALVLLSGCVETYQDVFWLTQAAAPLPRDAMVANDETAYNLHFDGEKYVFTGDKPAYDYAKLFHLGQKGEFYILQLKNHDAEEGYYYAIVEFGSGQMTLLGGDDTAAAKKLGIPDVRRTYNDSNIQLASQSEVVSVLVEAANGRDVSKDGVYRVFDYANDQQNAEARALYQKLMSK